MTDPSQYFKGRTVQEQMNEVIGYVDVRSAEVATDAIAADVAQVHQDMLDADADATAAAASAAAAAGTLANAVKKTGEASQSIDGDIDLNDDLNVDGDATVGGDLGVTGNLGVTGTATVPTPVNNTDAANKKYVDDQDALKISITDVNTYAVGLTGNQPVAGIKTLLGDGAIGGKAFNVKTKVSLQSDNSSRYTDINWVADNDSVLATLRFNNRVSSGVRGVQLILYNGSGTATVVNLGTVTI